MLLGAPLGSTSQCTLAYVLKNTLLLSSSLDTISAVPVIGKSAKNYQHDCGACKAKVVTTTANESVFQSYLAKEPWTIKYLTGRFTQPGR